MSRIFYIFFCAINLLACLLASGQRRQISLSTILSEIRHNAPSLRVDSASVIIERSNERVFYKTGLPNLRLNYQVNTGTNNNVPGGYFSFGIVPGNSRVREQSNATSILSSLGIVAFDWELYNFGGFGAEQKAAKADVDSEQAHFEQTKYELQARAIYQYFHLLMLRDLQTIQKRNITRNQEIRKSIQALAKSGIMAGVDTSIANAEVSRARQIYLELSGDYKKVQMELSSVSGIPADEISPDTTYRDKVLQYRADTNANPWDSLNHPLLKYYTSLRMSSLVREVMIRKHYLPKISLQAALWGRGASVTASDEFKSLSNGLDLVRTNYLVGVGVTYNIFDNWRKNQQLNIQYARTKLATDRLAEQRSMMLLSINQSEVDLSVSRERLLEIPQQLSAAQAAYRQKFSLYKNGLTNIVDLNAALFLLYRAEIDFTNAQFTYCEALFRQAVNENSVEELLNILN